MHDGSVSSDPIVRIRGVRKTYKGRAALSGVDLDIRRGEIFALLGPNGAGKSTLIGVVGGLVNPDAGTVQVDGFDVAKQPLEARRRIGLVPQEVVHDPFFTIAQTLRFQAGYFGRRLSDPELDALVRPLALSDRLHVSPRTLSGGMKRRLLIAKALVHDPSVLFLDEPTAGVDIDLRRDLWDHVRRMREQGCTIVLTTHYLEEAEQLADRIGVIDGGRLLLVDTKEALLRRFGRRNVTIRLARPCPRWSGPPVAMGLERSADGGTALHLVLDPAESLGPVLESLAQAGAEVVDVESSPPRLEQVLHKVLEQGRGEAPPGSGLC